VSRSAIREALQTLSTDGTLVREHGHSAVVRQFTREEVWWYHQIREVLEGLGAALAAGRSEQVQHHAELVEIDKGLEAFAARGDSEGFLQLNYRFHMLIMAMGGNPLIERHVEMTRTAQLRMLAARFMSPEDMRTSLLEHREITRAILSGDPAAAEAAMRKHIRGTRRIFWAMPESSFGLVGEDQVKEAQATPGKSRTRSGARKDARRRSARRER